MQQLLKEQFTQQARAVSATVVPVAEPGRRPLPTPPGSPLSQGGFCLAAPGWGTRKRNQALARGLRLGRA